MLSLGLVMWSSGIDRSVLVQNRGSASIPRSHAVRTPPVRLATVRPGWAVGGSDTLLASGLSSRFLRSEPAGRAGPGQAAE